MLQNPEPLEEDLDQDDEIPIGCQWLEWKRVVAVVSPDHFDFIPQTHHTLSFDEDTVGAKLETLVSNWIQYMS
jgi:hypothetical protein